eukprot:GFUD01016558.1.p1 GENE.GFUD01016558.1~~GFUD01016558.1.p1  ORF type:complete len:230 (-),score=55.57 GFUD01016558.1:169-858(-)
MDVESAMDKFLWSVRYLFGDVEDTKKEERVQLLQGNFIPIPSLRSLGFQSLVMNTFPVEEFLPGETFQDDARNLSLLTRDCKGKYRLVEFEDSLVYADNTEVSEEEKKDMRSEVLNNRDVVEVLKMSSKSWKINGLCSFNLAGCLRHVSDKITSQEWIEGSTLVAHDFLEWDYSEERLMVKGERMWIVIVIGKVLMKMLWVLMNKVMKKMMILKRKKSLDWRQDTWSPS